MKIRWIQKAIDKMRGKGPKGKLRIRGVGNVTEFCPEDAPRLQLSIEGDDNRVVIGKLHPSTRGILRVSVCGNHCSVIIGEGLFIGTQLSVIIGQNDPFHGAVEETHCRIGARVHLEQADITTYNSRNTISIGDDCMISLGVVFYNTDGHPVYDLAGGQLVNYVPDMHIGNHCWIGYRAVLLKGVQLADNTIVGWGSVVSRRFTTPHCAIAGNPAKVVKEGLTWDKGDALYVRNERPNPS